MIVDYVNRSETERNAIGVPTVGFFDLFQAQFGDFLQSENTAVAAYNNYQNRQFDPNAGDSLTLAEFSGSELGGESPVIEKGEWEVSEFFRPGLKHVEGMTERRAEYMADTWDRKRRLQFLSDRASGGAAIAAGLTGGLTASLLDPMNFVGLLGPARVFAVARLTATLGKVGGRAALGAAEAVAATALAEPILRGAAANAQQRRDAMMVMANMSFAAGIGGGLGAVGGLGVMGKALRRYRERQHVEAVGKAIQDIEEGRPVDTSQVLSPRHEADDAVRVALKAAEEGVEGLGEESQVLATFARNAAGETATTNPLALAAGIADAHAAPGFMRTASQNVLVRQFHMEPEAVAAARIAQIPSFKRTADEMVTLKAFLDDQIEARLETRVKTLGSALKEADTVAEALPLQTELLSIEGRLESLKTPSIEPSFDTVRQAPTEVPPNVAQAAKTFNEEQAASHRPVEGVDTPADEQLEVARQWVKQSEEEGTLSDVSREILDESKVTREVLDKRSAAIKDAALCLIEGD